MKAINNSGLTTFCHTCQTSWTPAATFSLNTSTNVLTIVDTTTYASGDDRNVLNLIVSDRHGNVKTSQMLGSDSDDTFTISLATGFVVTDGFNIQVMIVSNARHIADLTAYDVNKYGGTSGSLGYLDTTN